MTSVEARVERRAGMAEVLVRLLEQRLEPAIERHERLRVELEISADERLIARVVLAARSRWRSSSPDVMKSPVVGCNGR